MSIRILGNYSTDIKQFCYVLREGENDVPKMLKEAFENGVKVRNIYRKPGRTALERCI